MDENLLVCVCLHAVPKKRQDSSTELRLDMCAKHDSNRRALSINGIRGGLTGPGTHCTNDIKTSPPKVHRILTGKCVNTEPSHGRVDKRLKRQAGQNS